MRALSYQLLPHSNCFYLLSFSLFSFLFSRTSLEVLSYIWFLCRKEKDPVFTDNVTARAQRILPSDLYKYLLGWAQVDNWSRSKGANWDSRWGSFDQQVGTVPSTLPHGQRDALCFKDEVHLPPSSLRTVGRTFPYNPSYGKSWPQAQVIKTTWVVSSLAVGVSLSLLNATGENLKQVG